MAKPETAGTTNTSFYIKPEPGYVIVTPYKEQQVGGVYVSDDAAEKESAGEVVAVGDSYTYYVGNNSVLINSPVKVGDIVVFSNYSNQRYKDFKTSKTLFFLKFHIDPQYNMIMGVVDNG